MPPANQPGWSDLLQPSIDRHSPHSIFHQLYTELRRVILNGAAPPGTRLPATRQLATRLGISRTSVVTVYEQLLAEGYLHGRLGAGTYVSGAMHPPQPPAQPAAKAPTPTTPTLRYANLHPDRAQFESIPFNTGRCSVDERTLKIWRSLTAAALRKPDPLWFGYTDPRGSPRLREALATYLRAARGVHCDPAQIMILSGVQQAIDLVVKVLIEPNDPVWIEDPTYPAMHAALQAAQARIVPVPVDAQGLVVASGIAASPQARAAYVTPSHQYPTGVVLSMARRLELLAWARDARSWIIEDDYDSEFRYAGRPLASLQGIDRGERVIYLGTFSKVLFPGLRLGYAVIPYELLDAISTARFLTDRQAPALTETVVTAFIEQGHFGAHLRRMCAQYKTTRDVLVSALHQELGAQIQITAPDQGMHLTLPLPQGRDDNEVARAAHAQGIIVRPVSRFHVHTPPTPALMLGFTGYTAPTLREAATRLATIIRNGPAQN